MLTVQRIFTFEAAHHLPEYAGKCRSIHGHSYKLGVEVHRNGGLEAGMVMDFHELDRIVNSILDLEFDHKMLNDILPYPTAENILAYLHKKITMHLPDDVKIVSLSLWETENSCANWYPEKI